MFYKLSADVVVVFHFGFVIFVGAGGLLVLRWRGVALLHLPAVVWAALLEFFGWICPLTPLEQTLRAAAGQVGYSSGFIEHYIMPVLYPDGLDRAMQIQIGSVVVAINLVIYGWLLWRWKHPEAAE